MEAVVEWYQDAMANKSGNEICSIWRLYDPRTSNWFLVKSPVPVVVMVASHIFFCTLTGPRYMKNKKPYSLQKVLVMYNLFHILSNIYVFHEGLMSGWLRNYSFQCQPVDYSDNPNAMRMAEATHMYFINKLAQLLDTVFFVLRKKNQKISYLHIYHHSMMPLAAWIVIRFIPGGHPTFMGTMNAFVHVVMYTYHLLSSMGLKYLWWKKYVTILQLVQFCIVIVHCGQTLFMDCDIPKGLTLFMTINALSFLYFFGSLYVATYMKEEPKNGQQVLTKGKLNQKLD